MARDPFVKTLEHFAHVDVLMQDDAGVVVVLFHAGGTPPQQAPLGTLQAVARRFGDRPVRFASIDTRTRPGLAHRFQVGTATTALFFADGRLLDAHVGRLTADRVALRIESLMEHAGTEGLFSRIFAFARGA